MPVISSINILKFRGIEDLSIENLATVNVLAGANNCGKTSVLETIRLLSAPYSVANMSGLAFLRGSTGSNRINKIVEYVSSMYHKEVDPNDAEKDCFRIALKAEIRSVEYGFDSFGRINEVSDSEGNTRKGFDFSAKVTESGEMLHYFEECFINENESQIEIVPHVLFKAIYLHSGVNYYRSCVKYLSNSIIYEQKKELIHLLQSFESTIEDISIVGEDVYLHNSVSGTLPLFAYGTGLQKAVMLSGILASTPKEGVILIDEIDNAINISAFRDVFPWFVDSCRKLNIQSFVTTHSAEAIDSILDCRTEDYDDIRIITLRKTPRTHKTVAKVRTSEIAHCDRERFKMELRA